MNIDQHINIGSSETPKASIIRHPDGTCSLLLQSSSELNICFWGTEEQIKCLAKSINKALESSDDF